jgi:hypothetical protein
MVGRDAPHRPRPSSADVIAGPPVAAIDRLYRICHSSAPMTATSVAITDWKC